STLEGDRHRGDQLTRTAARNRAQRGSTAISYRTPTTLVPMAEPVRKTLPVAGAELDVLVGGRDEPGAGTVCTAHPTESMDAALPLLAAITRASVVCVNPR